MKEIRVGIVGCGRIAEVHHVPLFLEIEGVVVTALQDPVPERMEKLAALFPQLAEARRFATDTELFESGIVDAVAICTPNDCHYPQTLAACAAGLHVMCEKPMAATLEQATEMIAAAREGGLVLQINQSLRFSPPYRTLTRLVREGAIGDPFHVRCIRGHSGMPNEGWSPGADWFVQKKHDGGMLLDIGIHMADAMRMVMGDADSVAGLLDTRHPDIDVPDNISALFRYKNGGTGVLELSWTMPGGAGYLEVYGTRGRIRMGFSEQPIELWQADALEPESVDPDAPDADYHVSYPELREHESSQAAFCKAIRTGTPSPASGEYGRRALALCLAIEESSNSGRFTTVQHFEK